VKFKTLRIEFKIFQEKIKFAKVGLHKGSKKVSQSFNVSQSVQVQSNLLAVDAIAPIAPWSRRLWSNAR